MGIGNPTIGCNRPPSSAGEPNVDHNKNMKIRSSDPEFFIELISDNYDGVHFVEVRAKFGDFNGRNNNVHLENLSEFAHELDEFISDTTETPELKGTYGFRLTFFARSPAGRPRVRCNLGNTVCHPEGNRDFGIYGEFEIDPEYLNQYLAEIRELSRPFLGNGQQ